MNLGQLRKMIEHLGDDVEIITNTSNFEMSGSWVKAYGIQLVKVRKDSQQFRDAFDGTNYSAEVFIPDEDGIEVLKV